MERLERRRIIGEKVMLSDILLLRGCFVPVHAHENEQMAVVQSGRVRFQVGEPPREVVLTAGEVLVLPSNVPHSAEALEDSRVLDVFAPPSEGTGLDRR